MIGAFMKKLLVILLAIIGFASLNQPAFAQRFSAGAAITLFGPGGSALGFGISGNFAALDLLKAGAFGFDARATLDLDFNYGVELNFSGFARLNLRALNVYAGPTVSVLLGVGFGLGATIGIRSPVEQPIGFFGELEFLFVPAALRLRFGLNLLL
jgi:hypothetical protein